MLSKATQQNSLDHKIMTTKAMRIEGRSVGKRKGASGCGRETRR